MVLIISLILAILWCLSAPVPLNSRQFAESSMHTSERPCSFADVTYYAAVRGDDVWWLQQSVTWSQVTRAYEKCVNAEVVMNSPRLTVRAQYRLGYGYERCGRPEDAIPAYSKAIAAIPMAHAASLPPGSGGPNFYAAARHNRGLIYSSRGEYQSALPISVQQSTSYPSQGVWTATCCRFVIRIGRRYIASSDGMSSNCAICSVRSKYRLRWNRPQKRSYESLS